MFGEFVRSSRSARQPSVNETLQNERNAQSDTENAIKQSLKGIYTACNASFMESYGVYASVASIATVVTRIAVELQHVKNDREEINKSIDGLIGDLVPGNKASQLESNTRVKFSLLKPVIETAIRKAKAQVHTWVSNELNRGLSHLGLAPFVDSADTARAVLRFVSLVGEDHMNKKAANTELLHHLKEQALLQKVALTSNSTSSLRECLLHCLEQVSAELDALWNDRESLRHSSIENAGIVSHLRQLIDDSKKLMTGAVSTADEGRTNYEILDECIKAVIPQVQHLRAVNPRVYELQPDSTASSTIDRARLCVDGLSQARDALAQDHRDLTARMESVQTAVDAALQAQGDEATTETGETGETLLEQISSYVERLNERVEASESDAHAVKAALTKAAARYGAKEDANPKEQCSALQTTVMSVIKAKQVIINGAINYI